jgi:hypothetical protein
MSPNRGLNPGKCRIASLTFGGFRSANAQGATVIDEVKLYKHRLTAVEIANAYQRFLIDGKIRPLPPIDLRVAVNHPLRWMSATVDLLMSERSQVAAFDLQIIKTSETNALVDSRTDIKLDDGSRSFSVSGPKVTSPQIRLQGCRWQGLEDP